MTDTMKCRKCGRSKAPDMFPRNKHARGGIDRMCKACWKSRKHTSSALAPKSEKLAPPPDSVSAVQVREISNVLGLERGAEYECYLRVDGLERVVEHFYGRYSRLPDEIIVYNSYAYLKITPAESDFRKGLVFPEADVSADTAVVHPSGHIV